LPCPFCGSAASMQTTKETVDGKSKVEFSIRCHDRLYDCGCSPGTSTHKTEEAAVAAWNRRDGIASP
jgi:hypothetical protein